MDFYRAGIVKGFAWIREHWGSALGFALGVVFTSITDKVIESNDLEWLKAIWRGAWGFVVGAYDWLLGSAPIPVWLIVPVVALALVPIWQLAKRVRIAATAAPEIYLARTESMVLGAIQDMDEIRRFTATLPLIAEHTTLSLLETATALDRLESIKFISHSMADSYAVHPDGRAYLLDMVRSRT